MILGSRFLFTTALADKAHYIICLEEKFSAAACVAQGGLLEKIRQIFFFVWFCFILSGQFSFKLLENCTLKRLPKWKGKGQRAAALTILFFFCFFSFPFQKAGGRAAPAQGRVWGWGVGTAGCPVLSHCCWEVLLAQHRCEQRNPSCAQKRLKL